MYSGVVCFTVYEFTLKPMFLSIEYMTFIILNQTACVRIDCFLNSFQIVALRYKIDEVIDSYFNFVG